jgi:transcriptional regulator with XRE-family HTH domain
MLELLGDELRRRRYGSGFSQAALAAAAGVDQSTISRLERGLAPGLRLSRYASMLAVLRAAPYVAEGSGREPDDLEPTVF